MSSTERAPEPTMEDILASIRRIITDDEAGQATPEKPSQKAQAEDETIEGEADNQIIDDIARVLGGSGEAANQDEEILDLTAELGGLEIVEDEPSDNAVVAEVLELEEIEFVAAAKEPDEPAAALDAAALDAAALDAAALDVDTTAFDAQEPPLSEPAPPEAPVPTPEPVAAAPEPAAPESAASASEEAASALERAIAALRAGQVPAASETPAEPFQFQAQPEEALAADALPQDEPEAIPPEVIPPEVIPMAVPMPEPAPDSDTHPDPEAQLEPDVEANFDVELEHAAPLPPLEDDTGPEADLVLTEAGTEETATELEKPAFWPSEASQASSVQDFSVQDPSVQDPSVQEPSSPDPESEPVAEAAPDVSAAANGSGAHQGEGISRTLEDSIKDMLRPMLRQWLDDNMPRMIREEFDADASRGRRD